MDLNQYGAACRCLLRLRENEGKPGISDSAFIERYLPLFPSWSERPGETDIYAILRLAHELGLAGRSTVFRDYARVLQEHRAGQNILVSTERLPEQKDTAPAATPCFMILEHMDEEGFVLWCPFPSGHSDRLPKAARVWWDTWQSLGIVFQRPASPQG
jgi:hypothetical protein